MGMRWPGFRKVRGTVCKRVQRRLRELGLTDVAQYQVYLENNAEEWAALEVMCRIPLSRFYRDHGLFDYLGEVKLPEMAQIALVRGERELCCWCAGCASGEEPYTLNILWHLLLASRFPDLALEIIATDVDARMIRRAKNGCYELGSLKEVPETWLDSAFEQSEEHYRVRSQFRAGIQFRVKDIRVEFPNGPFHVIFCRNLVFTYFNEEMQQQLVEKMIATLRPGGILILGKHEVLPLRAGALVSCGRNLGVYQLS
jgi:chemotaxis protein methyltransferase CheR